VVWELVYLAPSVEDMVVLRVGLASPEVGHVLVAKVVVVLQTTYAYFADNLQNFDLASPAQDSPTGCMVSRYSSLQIEQGVLGNAAALVLPTDYKA
jgi:hypothetical protein